MRIFNGIKVTGDSAKKRIDEDNLMKIQRGVIYKLKFRIAFSSEYGRLGNLGTIHQSLTKH